MGPSQRRTVEPGETVLPTEQVPVVDDRDDGPIVLPEIVPATVDEPEVAPPATEPDVARRDPTESWTGAGGQVVPVAVPAAALRGGGLRPAGRRPRVRRVTRVVRHIDPWSTFKVAVVFSLVLYGVLLTAGVLLWNVAQTTGTVDNVERWFTQFGWETFELDGGQIFHNGWIAGLFGVVFLTGFAVLVATLFNLVSDMVGGVRLTVLEEEVVERTVSPTRRYVVRRLPVDEAAGAFDLDGDLPTTTPDATAADTTASDNAASGDATTGDATTAVRTSGNGDAPRAAGG